MEDNNEATAKVGCALLALYVVFAIAWISFIVWVIYTVVSWLVTK